MTLSGNVLREVEQVWVGAMNEIRLSTGDTVSRTGDSYKRAQAQKQNWRKNKGKIVAGMKKYHRKHPYGPSTRNTESGVWYQTAELMELMEIISVCLKGL